MKKLLVVLGPTSSGKTNLGIFLSRKLNGELIACDSRQIYKGLDIGTGKLPDKNVNFQKGRGFWKIDGIKIWLYDLSSPKNQYTVFNYVMDAKRTAAAITKRGKPPIILAGTGLYLKALLDGLTNISAGPDRKLRKELERLSLLDLQDKLQKISLKKWKKMNYSDRQNPRRLIRAIEIESGGEKGNKNLKGLSKDFNILKIGLNYPKDILYKRIDERIIRRLKQGMIEEAQKLNKTGLSLKRMRQLGLEYGILADFLERKVNKDELIKKLKGKIHGYAKRQITWFKKEKEVKWFDCSQRRWREKVEREINSWYHQ